MAFKTAHPAALKSLTLFFRERFRIFAYRLVPLIWLLLTCGLILHQQTAMASDGVVFHHNLELSIVPETHEITVLDTLLVKPHDETMFKGPLQFFLNRNLTLEEVHVEGKPIPFRIVDSSNDVRGRPSRIQIIEISDWENLSPTSPTGLSFRYKGTIHDPPRSSEGLRFVRPDKTDGYVGLEGVYLTSETAWYPTMETAEAASTFTIQVTLPKGWMAVTQGQQISHVSNQDTTTSKWEVDTVSEALTVVANQFVKNARDWNGIEMATYLFPEDASLADQYLDATEKYLEVYTTLLGPYPFRKFAVVENFFPSGIGLPSYTLLGSRVIKRGYTQPYSLGHEIVHSWFGNSIFNDFEKGNWVEGLTTYLANYYYDELQGHSEESLKTRRRMFFEYSLYAPPEKDYALAQFHHKETRIDNAIGYQKAAMVFHMLRRELGDQAFFSAIRTLVKMRSGAYADWGILEKVFEENSKRELSWFFNQWVQQPGAPLIKILHWDVNESQKSDGGATLSLTVGQQESPYRIRLPIMIDLADGRMHEAIITLHSLEQDLHIEIPSRPTRLRVDPEYETFRRFSPEQMPPMLNIWVTDQDRTLILPKESSPDEQAAFQPILDRLHSQKQNVVHQKEDRLPVNPNSLLVLSASPGDRLQTEAFKSCPQDIQLEANQLRVRNQTFEGSNIAWLVSCPHPTDPGHSITVFSGFSPSAISRVARLLFFYGWDSYLVFNNGKVVGRGMFEPIHKDLEISLKAA